MVPWPLVEEKRLADSTDLVYRGSPRAGLTRALLCQGCPPGASLQRSSSRQLSGDLLSKPHSPNPELGDCGLVDSAFVFALIGSAAVLGPLYLEGRLSISALRLADQNLCGRY